MKALEAPRNPLGWWDETRLRTSWMITEERINLQTCHRLGSEMGVSLFCIKLADFPPSTSSKLSKHGIDPCPVPLLLYVASDGNGERALRCMRSSKTLERSFMHAKRTIKGRLGRLCSKQSNWPINASLISAMFWSAELSMERLKGVKIRCMHTREDVTVQLGPRSHRNIVSP